MDGWGHNAHEATCIISTCQQAGLLPSVLGAREQEHWPTRESKTHITGHLATIHCLEEHNANLLSVFACKFSIQGIISRSVLRIICVSKKHNHRLFFSQVPPVGNTASSPQNEEENGFFPKPPTLLSTQQIYSQLLLGLAVSIFTHCWVHKEKALK